MQQEDRQANNLQQFRLFVERNPELLQKLYERCFTDNEFTNLSEVPRKELLTFTKELFGFNRQPFSSKEMQQTIDISLMESFINYEQENPEEQLQLRSVVKMLEYCIETNKTFAVQYKPKPVRQEAEEEEEEQPAENGQQNQQQPEEQDSRRHATDAAEEKERVATEPIDKPAQEAALARRLAIVFDFYCKQQQNVGSNTTFDRISHECSVMNLGKFLIFCHGYGVTTEQLNKYLLMEKFKKIAEGRKEIAVQKFVELLRSLREVDPDLTNRIHLDSEKMFKQKLKMLNIPFSTKGGMKHEPTVIHHPKLTSHSGKTSEELVEYVTARKLEKKQSADRHVATPIPSPPMPRKYKEISTSKDSKSKPKHSYSQLATMLQQSNMVPDSEKQIRDLGLDKLIIMEETDDEWLREYKIHTSSAKPQPHQPPHPTPATHQYQNSDPMGTVQRSHQNLRPMLPTNSRPLHSSSKTIIEPPTKNESIVSSIRKRIVEIGRSENVRDSLHMMKLNTMVNQQQRKLSQLKNKA